MTHEERRELERKAERIQNIILIVAALVAGAIILYVHLTQEKRERTAYLEGYYGVSHAVAQQMAEKEVR